MSDFLRTRPATTPAMLAVFDDAQAIRHGLAFESALARAQAIAGLVAPAIAENISSTCTALVIDPQQLAEEAAFAGTLAIPLVARLRAALSAEAARAVHRGATSQDVADTILMMQAKAATELLDMELADLAAALRVLARRHSGTPATGRTLLQDALPIGFGLRIAQWHAGIENAARRLRIEVEANASLQFGGAAGTRAGLDAHGAEIARGMARMLGLADAVPWHGQRVGIAAIACALGLLIGALGKVARDVSLLAQNAIGEVREPAATGRGGSSAMAHKRNPTGCQIALSAAIRAPGLLAAIVGGLPQEHERGLGGWQAEAPALTDLFLLAAGALHAMATVIQGLEVDTTAIVRNLESASIGTDIGESEAIVAAILAQDRSSR